METLQNIEALGIDIGGVIISHSADDRDDTSLFGNNYIHAEPVEEAFYSIQRLVFERFHDSVYLISKSGPRIQQRTLDWLKYHNFYNQTGVNPNHIHFCSRRQDKAIIARSLRITHFIDDRLEVLGYLPFIPNRYLFSPNAAEIAKYSQYRNQVKEVASWKDILVDLNIN